MTLVLASTLIAQESQTKIGFVDSQAVISAHPDGVKTDALKEQARQEIEAIQVEIKTLVDSTNGAQPTADQQSRFQLLQQTLADTRKRYEEEIVETVKPALAAVDEAIRTVAQENGYTIILDRGVAGPQQLNLVVYAEDGLDITDLVIERVRAE